MAQLRTSFSRPIPQAASAPDYASRPPRQGGVEPILRTVLTTAAVALLLCGVIWLYASNVRPASSDRMILAAALVAPAAYFAFTHSTLLLDHFLLIVVVNRLLRRLMDWGEGRYDPLPIISLLPLVTAGFMLISVYQNWHRLPGSMKRALALLVGGIGYGLAVGVFSYGISSAYACAEWVTPLVVLYYAVSCRPTAAVQRRWTAVLATLGVMASAYGIVQWFDVPGWDAAWLIWSGMFSSQGAARAFGMSIMSTLESRGPASMFFAAVAAAFIALPILRRRGGVVFGVLPVVALLLTTARTGLIYLLLTLLISSVLSRGAAGFKIVVTLLVIGTAATALLSRQSEAGRIFDRVATLADLENDGSATGRLEIAQRGFDTALTNPQGFGFGSGGNATRAGKNEQDAVGDNGYLEIFTTLGALGTLLYFGGLFMILAPAFRDRGRLPTGAEPAASLGFGMALAFVPALVVGNCLITAHASYVWIMLSRHLAAAKPVRAAGRRRPAWRGPAEDTQPAPAAHPA